MLFNDPKHRGPITRGPYIAYNGGLRPDSAISLIVVHDAEGANAKNVAAWGAGGQRNASWHFVVDDTHLIRQVPDNVIAWTAPGTNKTGLQIEICGFARWSKLTWYRHQSTLKRAAWQVARWCHEYDIPARYMTDAQLANGYIGITFHAQATRVFGGSHTDPGPNFPYSYFLFLVKRRLKWLRQGR
jgi:N-acetyl-anhydromuramyl-L-alanine amidase AmpD